MPHMASPELATKHIRHLCTVRGHKMAVYCLTFDNTGRRLITGSDDWLVKVRDGGGGGLG